MPFLAVALFSVVLLFTDPGVQVWLQQWNWASVRDWVSALSGWAAAFAAFATIIVILKQIKQADQHHREVVRIQQRELYNVAEKARVTLSACRVRAEPLAAAYGDLNENMYRENYPQIIGAFKELAAWFDSDTIDEFEKRIWIDRRNDLSGVRSQIGKALELLEKWEANGRYLLQRDALKRISRDLTLYCDAALLKAEEFREAYERT